MSNQSTQTKEKREKSPELFAEFYTKKQLLELLGIGNTTLHYWIHHEGFPPPFYLSMKNPLWVKTEIPKWVQAKRDGKIPRIESRRKAIAEE